MLLGSVANNPNLIVQETYQRLKEGAESIVAAVNDAVRIRLWAIFMSSLTTIFGIAPLVLIPRAATGHFLICSQASPRLASAEAIMSEFSVPHSHSGAKARERLRPLDVKA